MPIALVLFLVCLCTAILDDEPVRDPWAGHPVGAWVIHKEVRTLDGLKQERRTKSVITSFDKAHAAFKVMNEENGAFKDTGAVRLHMYGLLPGSLPSKSSRKEKLTIEGKTIECQVEVYGKEENGRKVECTVWKSDAVKVPYRELDTGGPDVAMLPNVLRLDMDYQKDGDSGKYRMEVTILKQQEKIGDKTVDCVVEKGTYVEKTNRGAIDATVERWLCQDIPGHEAKFIIKGTMNGKPVVIEKVAVEFKK